MNFGYIKTNASILEEIIPEQFYFLDIKGIELHEVKEDGSKIANAKRKDFVIYFDCGNGEIILNIGFYVGKGNHRFRNEHPSDEEFEKRIEFFGKESVLSAEEYNQIISETV